MTQLQNPSYMVRYVLFGLLFVVVGESFVHVMFNETIVGLFYTLIYYTLILILGFLAMKFIRKVSRTLMWFLLVMIALFGSLGLFVMDLAFGNPDANQIAMFIWWAGVFTFPLLWTEASPHFSLLRRHSLQYHALYTGTLIIMLLFLPLIPAIEPFARPIFIYGLFPYGYFLSLFVWQAKKIQTE